MYQINYSNPSHIHFIGIGGISMSGLAAVLLDRGFDVSGSDSKRSPLTDLLAQKGARIIIGQSASNIEPDTDAVVYTAAVHEDNPEFAAAKAAGIPMLTRAEMLGQMMDHYSDAAAVAGTHGKTTTTSMLSNILLASDMDPTISVGGILPSIGGNIRVGGSEHFVTEACEYTNSFLQFHPQVGIILNIDADHLDFFKDLDDIRHSFRLFAEGIRSGGTLIIPASLPDLEGFTEGLAADIVTFGIGEGDYAAEEITMDDNACASFTLFVRGEKAGRFTLRVPGRHNVLNAAAAIAAADIMGASRKAEAEGLSSFTGAERRFEYKGRRDGVTVIDDYAHHPTEIKATLAAAREIPHGTIWCAFQPHTFTRTKMLFNDFAEALTGADHVVLTDIYAARETDTLGVSSSQLAERIRELGTPADYFPNFSEAEAYLRKSCVNGDLLITMGAGNIFTVGEDFLKD